MNKCEICGNEFIGRYCNICGNEYKEKEKLICPKCGTKAVKGSVFCNMCGSPLQNNVESNMCDNMEEDMYYQQQTYVATNNNGKKAMVESNEKYMQTYKETANTYLSPFGEAFGINNRIIIKWVLYGLNWILFVIIVCLLIFGKAFYPSEEIYRKNYLDYQYDGYTSRIDMGLTLFDFSKGILTAKKSSDDISLLGNVAEILVIWGVIFAIFIILYVYALVKGMRRYRVIAKSGRCFACMAAFIAGWAYLACNVYNKEYGNMSVTPFMIIVIIMAVIKLTILIPAYINVCDKIYDNEK